MPNVGMSGRAALAAALVVISAGCSGSGSGGSGSGGSGLEAALARVADTPNNQSVIYYDNTSALVSLVGKSLSAEAKGYGELRGNGATNLVSSMALLPHDTGINLLDESYAITAGAPPASLTLVADGQDGTLVTGQMTKLGWKKGAGGTLAGPSPTTASMDTAEYAIHMRKVQAANSDVLIGGASADLSQIGSPSGSTLADNPGIKALAGCLGNVVAATMYGGRFATIKADPTEVAVGISQPAKASVAPHAVVCVSWPSQAAADTYAANVRKVLATGLSLRSNERYSALLGHATVTNVGGDAHIVEWQAAPVTAETVFEMQVTDDLPALPNCGKITALEAAQIIGCH